MLEGATIFALVVAAFVVITALMGVRQVPQGYNYTVERFGRYYKTLTPGLGLIVPYIDSVGRKLNVMEQVMDVPSQEIITKDNATVTVDGVAFYQVLDARRAAYEISDLQSALRNIVMTNVRTVMGSMDLDQLLSHRDEINARLLTVIDAASEPWGIKVTRVEIKDIVPPRDLVDAMGRQMKAEREKRAVILEAEGMRQSDITRAEGRKAALVLEAEGRRDAAFRAAEAVERTAEAEAMATRVISEATANGDVVAVNFLIAEKYIAALHALAQSPNQKLVIVPMELSSLAGTLGGLSQIAASAMGAEAVAAPRPPARPRPPGPVPNTGATNTPPVSPGKGLRTRRRAALLPKGGSLGAYMDALLEPAHLVRARRGSSRGSFSARSRRSRPAHSSSGSAPRRRSSEPWTTSCRWASSRSSFCSPFWWRRWFLSGDGSTDRSTRGPGRCHKAARMRWSGPTSSWTKRSREATGASASATVPGASPDRTARPAPW